MSCRTSPRTSPHAPQRGEPRRRAVAESFTAVAVILGAGTVLAVDAAGDAGPADLRPAAAGVVVPAAPLPAATVAADGASTSGAPDPAAMVAAREQAAADASARLAAEREAARLAQEQAEAEAAAAARAAERAAVWDRLADCESGRWDRDERPVPGTARWDYGLHPSEDGFFQGGLQFHPVTWDEFRDPDMPDHAGNATRSQQIAIAERVLEAQGWRAWPVCSRKLGYR